MAFEGVMPLLLAVRRNGKSKSSARVFRFQRYVGNVAQKNLPMNLPNGARDAADYSHTARTVNELTKVSAPPKRQRKKGKRFA